MSIKPEMLDEYSTPTLTRAQMKERHEDADLHRHQRELQSINKVREAIRTIVDELNHMGQDNLAYWGIVRELCRTHRTLQQNFMRTVVPAIVDFFADQAEDGSFDGRNAESCRLAVLLKDVLKGRHLPFI